MSLITCGQYLTTQFINQLQNIPSKKKLENLSEFSLTNNNQNKNSIKLKIFFRFPIYFNLKKINKTVDYE